MFRQFLRLSSAVRPSARLVAQSTHRPLGTSSIDPADASKRKTSKLAGQRPDDLWESFCDFTENAEQSFKTAAQPSERPRQSSERPRYPNSIRPDYARRPGEESGHRLPQLASKPTDQDLSDHLNGALDSVRDPEGISRFLDSIKPALPELEGHQFSIVYKALSEQSWRLQVKQILSLRQYGEALRNSTGYDALLRHTNSKIGEIDTESLMNIFKFLRDTRQYPHNEIFRNVTEQIVERLDELSLDKVSVNLVRAGLYANEFPDCGELMRFRANLLENCRRRILNDELEPDNFKQLSFLFYNFLANCQSEQAIDMLDRLTRTLLSDFELDFTRSIRLLGLMLSSMRGVVEEKAEYPPVLTELIEKCNSAVYATLKAEPEATDNYYAYLDQVHRHRSRLHQVFSNFFDPRLLDLLGPPLAKNKTSLKGPRPHWILNMIHNYSNVNTFNQELTEFACQLICNGAISHQKLTVIEYLMLAKYRFPFVNRQQLLNVLKSSNRFLNSLKKRDRAYVLLCDLILSEVNDPGMLNYLAQNVSIRPETPEYNSRNLSLHSYEQTSMARVVLSMFGQVKDKELNAKLAGILEQRFRHLCNDGHRPFVSSKYLSEDTRLQHPAYLTNGVVIDGFGIYDRSIGDLLPLEQFRYKFEEVNSIALTDNQQL